MTTYPKTVLCVDQEEVEEEILSTCKRTYQRFDTIVKRVSNRWPLMTVQTISVVIDKLETSGALRVKKFGEHSKWMRA